MNNSKDRFEVDYQAVGRILKSQEIMDVAIKEAEKIGNIEEKYVGTQRVWVGGREE